VAQSLEEFQQLVKQLQEGPTFVVKKKPEIPLEEDSLTDYAGIIRDTRPLGSYGTSNATRYII